jgi:hypothetical protein
MEYVCCLGKVGGAVFVVGREGELATVERILEQSFGLRNGPAAVSLELELGGTVSAVEAASP